MTDLIEKIAHLSEEDKKRVEAFIDGIIKTGPKKHTPEKRFGYGVLKGKINMASDFDAPLEDFKDYM